MNCAGCGRPVGRDDHLVAVSPSGRLLAGLSPWCQACFFSRSFGGRKRWFEAIEQPCTCSCSSRGPGCRCGGPHVEGPCHLWAHDNLVVLVKALSASRSFVPEGQRPPKPPTFRAYNVLGRCVAWAE